MVNNEYIWLYFEIKPYHYLVDSIDATRVEENALGQRRFARVDVRRNTNIADVTEIPSLLFRRRRSHYIHT